LDTEWNRSKNRKRRTPKCLDKISVEEEKENSLKRKVTKKYLKKKILF